MPDGGLSYRYTLFAIGLSAARMPGCAVLAAKNAFCFMGIFCSNLEPIVAKAGKYS